MTNRPAKTDTATLVAIALAGLAVWLWMKPEVDPVPPGPTPPPEPTPSAISVLIVEETADRLKPEMRPYLGVFNSVEIRKYLNAHCKTVDGEPHWLWVDDDVDLTDADPYWKDAMALPRKSLPWIAISNGSRGVSGPLPQSEDEVLALLKKWGGE